MDSDVIILDEAPASPTDIEILSDADPFNSSNKVGILGPGPSSIMRVRVEMDTDNNESNEMSGMGFAIDRCGNQAGGTDKEVVLLEDEDTPDDIQVISIIEKNKFSATDDEVIPIYDMEDNIITENPEVEIVDEQPGEICRHIPAVKKGPSCFNCGGPHTLMNCQEVRDRTRIDKNRRMFRPSDTGGAGKGSRYHHDLEQRYGMLQPGKLSDEIRSALGLKPEQLPRHVYNMRIFGYPPGWKAFALEQTSSLKVYGFQIAMNPMSEQNIKLIPSRIFTFPGFNTSVPQGFREEGSWLGIPPFSKQICRERFIDQLLEEQERQNGKMRNLNKADLVGTPNRNSDYSASASRTRDERDELEYRSGRNQVSCRGEYSSREEGNRGHYTDNDSRVRTHSIASGSESDRRNDAYVDRYSRDDRSQLHNNELYGNRNNPNRFFSSDYDEHSRNLDSRSANRSDHYHSSRENRLGSNRFVHNDNGAWDTDIVPFVDGGLETLPYKTRPVNVYKTPFQQSDDKEKYRPVRSGPNSAPYRVASPRKIRPPRVRTPSPSILANMGPYDVHLPQFLPKDGKPGLVDLSSLRNQTVIPYPIIRMEIDTDVVEIKADPQNISGHSSTLISTGSDDEDVQVLEVRSHSEEIDDDVQCLSIVKGGETLLSPHLNTSGTETRLLGKTKQLDSPLVNCKKRRTEEIVSINRMECSDSVEESAVKKEKSGSSKITEEIPDKQDIELTETAPITLIKQEVTSEVVKLENETSEEVFHNIDPTDIEFNKNNTTIRSELEDLKGMHSSSVAHDNMACKLDAEILEESSPNVSKETTDDINPQPSSKKENQDVCDGIHVDVKMEMSDAPDFEVDSSGRVSETIDVEQDVSGNANVETDISSNTDVKPDVSGKANVEPNIFGSADVKPDVSGNANVETDISSNTDVKPDVSGKANVEPDISGSADVKPDVSGNANVEPNIFGSADVKPDVSGNANVEPNIFGSGADVKPDVSGNTTVEPYISGSVEVDQNMSDIINVKQEDTDTVHVKQEVSAEVMQEVSVNMEQNILDTVNVEKKAPKDLGIYINPYQQIPCMENFAKDMPDLELFEEATSDMTGRFDRVLAILQKRKNNAKGLDSPTEDSTDPQPCCSKTLSK